MGGFRHWVLLSFLICLMLFATPEPAAARVLRGIEYGRAGGQALLMDVHTPSGNGPFAAAVIVHGGAWVTGDRRTNVEPLFQPLEEAGIAWFSISYRLASDVSLFGAAIQDVIQAVQYVRSHAAEYNIDPTRLALIGESAGAQLAAMAALSPALKGALQGVVAFYCPCDLVELAENSQAVPSSLRQAVEATPYAGFVRGALRSLSPLQNVRKDMPPFLLIHGTSDTLVPFDQSTRMCDRMREVGASCRLYPVRGGGHGLRWWESGHAAYKRVMIEWLDQHLAQRQAAHR
jgi:alpha-L-fucosidase 2